MMWRDGELRFPYQTNSGKKSAPQNEDKTSVKVSNKKEEQEKSDNFSPETLRLSQIFECPPAGDNDLRNEKTGFYVSFEPTKQEIKIRVNTFVNPYTQDVETVYRDRVNRFKAFEPLATVSADNPSKLGFMKITLRIHQDKATDNLILRIKDAIDQNNREWEKHECKVCSKAIYNGAECYFEGSWWYVHRAVIMNKKSYERYDFSDEMEFDEDMWDIETGGYDNLEFEDSFTLISPSEFQKIWDSTPREHKPKQR